MLRCRWALAPVLIALLPACAEMDLTNPNEAGVDAIDAAMSEALIIEAYQRWDRASHGSRGPGQLLSAASFQYATPACHASFFSMLPRRPLPNSSPDPPTGSYDVYVGEAWYGTYEALTKVSLGMRRLEANPEFRTELGEAETARLEAFARFVQGLGHANLAVLYDRAFVSDENTDLLDSEMVDYPVLMDTALAFLERAAELSAGQDWPDIPPDWMTVSVSADQLARLAHSYAARYRAAVARTPGERAAVDWAAVIADVDAGVTEDFIYRATNSEGWGNFPVMFAHLDRWSGTTYYVWGMADPDGAAYRAWLDLPLDDKRPDVDGAPVLIVTPDERFPRGSTLSEQQADSSGLFWTTPTIDSYWHNAVRGTWRWSYYKLGKHNAYANGAFMEGDLPAIPVAEMRLLKAEGLYRSGNRAGAAAIVNETREAAGLTATDAMGTNVDCVPRLPDGRCGDLWEMLKWEKRLESLTTGPYAASMFFDARGWGELYAGTFLHFPVPCEDLTILQQPCYTFGGAGGDGAADVGGYGW